MLILMNRNVQALRKKILKKLFYVLCSFSHITTKGIETPERRYWDNEIRGQKVSEVD